MAVHINEDCINCGLCIQYCPNRAIADLDRDDERRLALVKLGVIGDDVTFVVDPDLCTECHGFYDEPKCASYCPTEAIPVGERFAEMPEQLSAKAERLATYRESLGLPRNIAYAEKDNAGLPPERGFGPKPPNVA